MQQQHLQERNYLTIILFRFKFKGASLEAYSAAYSVQHSFGRFNQFSSGHQ